MMLDDQHDAPGLRRRDRAPTTLLGMSPAYLRPNSIAAVRELASLMAAAEWAPSSYRSNEGTYVIEKIILGIMHGAAVGLGPFAAIHAIAVIDGHPTIWGDGALALVERSGLVEDMREDYTLDAEEGLTAVCTIRRRPWPTPITRRFSMAMAEAARLTMKEGPWQTYPRRMLMMRARSWALRDGFADVLRGLSIREEVEDYDQGREASISRSSGGNAAIERLEGGASRPRFDSYVEMATGVRERPTSPDGSPCASGQLSDSCAAPETPQEPQLSHTAAVTEQQTALTSEPMAFAFVSRPRETALNPPAVVPVRPNATIIEDVAVSPAASVAVDAEPDTVSGLAGPAYAVIDMDGKVVEADSLSALRLVFNRLFTETALSPDQVLGLWESNELARHELEQTFGSDVLFDAERRWQAADRANQHPAQSNTTGTAQAQSNDLRRRSRSSGVQRKGSAQRTDLSLHIDPTWSDEILFHHYRKRLLALKRRRSRAESFVDFRRANCRVEARLREQLPHLMTEVDAIYVWAATAAS